VTAPTVDSLAPALVQRATERLAARLRWALLVALWGMLLGSYVHALLAPRPTATAPSPFAADTVAVVVLALVAIVTTWLVLTNRPPGDARWWLLAVVLAASAGARAPRGQELVLPQHWTYGVVGWFGVSLLMDLGWWALAGLLAANSALILAQVALAGEATRHAVAALTVTTSMAVVFQFTAYLSATLLWRGANAARRSVEQEEQVRTVIHIAGLVARDRETRVEGLATTTVPLLRALADQSADPADPAVRAACAVEAARIRRLFAERDDVPDPLAHELQACIDTAERAGIAVTLAIRGTRPPLAREIRRALTEPVIRTLAAARGSARVTLIGSATEVTVSVVAAVREPAARPEPRVDAVAEGAGAGTAAGDAGADAVDGHSVRIARFATSGRVWLEARWTTAA
jgi:hypothetical protein